MTHLTTGLRICGITAAEYENLGQNLNRSRGASYDNQIELFFTFVFESVLETMRILRVIVKLSNKSLLDPDELGLYSKTNTRTVGNELINDIIARGDVERMLTLLRNGMIMCPKNLILVTAEKCKSIHMMKLLRAMISLPWSEQKWKNYLVLDYGTEQKILLDSYKRLRHDYFTCKKKERRVRILQVGVFVKLWCLHIHTKFWLTECYNLGLAGLIKKLAGKTSFKDICRAKQKLTQIGRGLPRNRFRRDRCKRYVELAIAKYNEKSFYKV